MRNAAATRLYVPESAQVAQCLLADLKQAHRDLLAELDNMDGITRQATCDKTRCATGRWKISQASLGRRVLAGRICDYFLTRCEPADVGALRELQEADRELLRASVSHVARWPAEAIERDWRGYCKASQEIRWQMHAHIAAEQRLLCPLLDRAARR